MPYWDTVYPDAGYKSIVRTNHNRSVRIFAQLRRETQIVFLA